MDSVKQRVWAQRPEVADRKDDGTLAGLQAIGREELIARTMYSPEYSGRYRGPYISRYSGPYISRYSGCTYAQNCSAILVVATAVVTVAPL